MLSLVVPSLLGFTPADTLPPAKVIIQLINHRPEFCSGLEVVGSQVAVVVLQREKNGHTHEASAVVQHAQPSQCGALDKPQPAALVSNACLLSVAGTRHAAAQRRPYELYST